MTKLPFRKSGKVVPWKFTVIYLGSCFPGKFLPTVKNRICCAKSVVKRLIDRALCQHKAERTFPWYSCIFCIAPIWDFENCAFDGYFLRLLKYPSTATSFPGLLVFSLFYFARLHLHRNEIILSLYLYRELNEEKLDIERQPHCLATERLRWTDRFSPKYVKMMHISLAQHA